MSDGCLRPQAITFPILRLASGSSRVSAYLTWLRPRCARLTPLTKPSVEPGPGIYVMARQVYGRFDIGLDSKEGKDISMTATSITPSIGVTIGRLTQMLVLPAATLLVGSLRCVDENQSSLGPGSIGV